MYVSHCARVRASLCTCTCLIVHVYVPHCARVRVSLCTCTCLIVHVYVSHCARVRVSLCTCTSLIVHVYVSHCARVRVSLCTCTCKKIGPTLHIRCNSSYPLWLYRMNRRISGLIRKDVEAAMTNLDPESPEPLLLSREDKMNR